MKKDHGTLRNLLNQKVAKLKHVQARASDEEAPKKKRLKNLKEQTPVASCIIHRPCDIHTNWTSCKRAKFRIVANKERLSYA